MIDSLPQDILVNLPAFETLDPSVLKIAFVVVFVFIFLLLLAFTRHHIIHTSLKGLRAGLITGVLGVLIIEGALLVVVKDYILGEKAAVLPQNVQTVLEDSRSSVTKVMGTSTERKRPTAQEVVSDYKILSPIDAELVRSSVCKQEDGY
ncbi:MAG: hypothetical protein HYU80_01735 [Candidatus Blackburnbacteria bacterium]|nr:hypothetical protein [Candidatus Blackburnbacteria bacterium]